MDIKSKFSFQRYSLLGFGYLQTLIIAAFFLFIVYNFYFSSGNELSDNVILSVVILAVLADGVFLLLHLPRRPVSHRQKLTFDPSKLTVIIACLNGEGIIGKTIESALTHVKPQNIIVISDASTDTTAQVARAYGVQVIENVRNVNKAFSVSAVMHHVKTPYVLILDDDTLIGNTLIPTNLLDEGYDAVAFNVMPLQTGSILNKLQQFEYRKSMTMGKNLRAANGAVGNISGAIGLYRTSDLIEQVKVHSGQFGSEDQQRTSFVHLHGKGKGITYTDEIVLTKAPETLRQLFRQRSFRWNLSLPELFFIYLRILANPRFHYLLKVEKAYQMYLLVTDPIRMLFFWTIFFHPLAALVMYGFYVIFTAVVLIKTKRQDPLWIIFVYPIYSLMESICRYIAHFYWFRIKYTYLFKEKFHKLVTGRNLVHEYAGVFSVIVVLWGFSLARLNIVVAENFLQVPVTVAIADTDNENNGNVLAISEIPVEDIEVAEVTGQTSSIMTTSLPDYVQVVQSGESLSLIARRAILFYERDYQLQLSGAQRMYVESKLTQVRGMASLNTGETVSIPAEEIENYVILSKSMSDYEVESWASYARYVDFNII
jgi:cellulose synthase/poly-beta-1,6-N-acetylglucosamine synthase-like glycosyltransferase